MRELGEQNGQDVAMQKGKEGEKLRSKSAQGEGGEGGLTLTREQGPVSKSAQGEGGAGVLSPTGQQGSTPKPGAAHRENEEGVPRKTGDKDPNAWGKPALQVMMVKQGPPPPPLLLNRNYNHSSEGEPMEVDEGAQPPKHKRGEKKDSGQDEDEWEGDDNEEEDDNKVVEVKHYAPKKGQGEMRRPRSPRPLLVLIEYYILWCQCCQRLDCPCQVQKTMQACYICAKFKVACKGQKGPLYDSLGLRAKPSAPEELETMEMGPTDGEWESPKIKSSKKANKRKGKSKFTHCLIDYQKYCLAMDTGDEGEVPHKKRPV